MDKEAQNRKFQIKERIGAPTLVDILVVIGLLGILVSIFVPAPDKHSSLEEGVVVRNNH